MLNKILLLILGLYLGFCFFGIYLTVFPVFFTYLEHIIPSEIMEYVNKYLSLFIVIFNFVICIITKKSRLIWIGSLVGVIVLFGLLFLTWRTPTF